MNINPDMQLRHMFMIASGATPSSGNDDYWDGDLLWVTPQDLSEMKDYWLTDTHRKISDAGYRASGTVMAPIHSIVLSKRAPIGQLAVLKKSACSNQGCLFLIPQRESDSRFFFYWLTCQTEYLQALGRGSTFMELSTDDLKSIHIPSLALSQQRAIADYLDRETTRLDRLVTAKEWMLELLAERRRALIATAVTGGISRGKLFRDSGIPWLRKIPSHWKIERAKRLFEERDERSETGKEDLLTVSHITGVTLRAEKNVNMFEAATTEGYKICQPGDLVVNTLWAWMGAMGVSPRCGIVSPAYNVYVPGAILDPGYVDAIVRLPVFAQEVTRYSKGVWSSRLRLYPEGLYEVSFPVPPLDEQREIAAYIADETSKLDSLMAEISVTITFLKERRAALIAAAVTGQIDVENTA